MTGPNPDDVLANIDAVLGGPHEVAEDWEVSGDAMRSIPVDETDLPDWEPPAADGGEPSFVVVDETHAWSAAQLREMHAAVNTGGRRPYSRWAINHPRQHVRPPSLEPPFIRHTNDLCRAGPVVLSTSQRLRAEFRARARAELTNAAAWGEPKAVEVLASALSRTPWGYWRRVAVYARALAGRVRVRLPRRRRRFAMGGTITLDVTPDVSRLREAFAGLGVSAHAATFAFSGLSEALARAAERELAAIEAERYLIDRWYSTDTAFPQLQEIRSVADVHRHELRRWLDDHLDTVYANLGLVRERPSVSEFRWRSEQLLRTVEEATRRGTLPMQVLLGFDGSISDSEDSALDSDPSAAVPAQTSDPLTPVDEDQLIGYAHAPRILATLRNTQEVPS